MRIILEPSPGKAVTTETGIFTITGQARYSQRFHGGMHSVVGKVADETVVHLTSNNLGRTGFLRFPLRSADDPEVFFRHFFTDRYLDGLRYEIGAWHHLSAVREESERVIVASSPPRDDVGQRGEHALPHLQRILEQRDDGNDGERAEFVLRHTAAVAGVDQLHFDSTMKGYLAHCQARNIQTGATAYISDFGFGVSQCLPIFLQGAITPPGHLLMVEQPEAQLHPTAQIEMGSFFADLWVNRRVPSIVETHSGNLLLRLRRLIANPEHPLQSEDVSVAYVHVHDKLPVVNNLEIAPDGSIKGLPMEFFGADVLEGMKVGARK